MVLTLHPFMKEFQECCRDLWAYFENCCFSVYLDPSKDRSEACDKRPVMLWEFCSFLISSYVSGLTSFSPTRQGLLNLAEVLVICSNESSLFCWIAIPVSVFGCQCPVGWYLS
jgi:hypothetical protein